MTTPNARANRPGKLIFDLGGVLVRIKSVSPLWSGSDLEPEKAAHSQIWRESRTVRSYETGLIRGLDEFYRSAREEMGITISRQAFAAVFPSLIGDLYAESKPLLEALRPSFDLYLLSNIGADHWLYCRDQLGIGTYFDQVFLSCEMGFLKPDPRIFQQMLQQIDDNPENIHYFDDRRENLETARNFGISGSLIRGGNALKEEVHRLGLIEE